MTEPDEVKGARAQSEGRMSGILMLLQNLGGFGRCLRMLVFHSQRRRYPAAIVYVI